MMSRLALWLALRIVRVVAAVVPRAARADWTREWDAELRHQSAQPRHGRDRTWRTDMTLLRRALGSIPDAAWLRRQFTLDADVVHDAVHAVRMLVKTPGFTAIALLVFALGIGATTAIISVADAFFVRDLPVRQPDRVMTVWQHNRETGATQQDVAPANAIDWMTRIRSFEAVAVAEPWTVQSTLTGQEPVALEAARVSEFFTVLGAPMLYGRPFLSQEYQREGESAAIVSYSMWRDVFGGDPSIVGRRVRMNDVDTFTVVGVLRPDFELRLFDNRATRPEPSVWLPKRGFEPFEPTLRGAGF